MAGEATLEVEQPEAMAGGGELANHFVMTVKTSPFVDLFYKVRDRIESYASQDLEQSLLYIKKQTGKSKRDVVVTFDWHKKQAQYSNFGQTKAPISLMPGTIDPLTAIYFIRQSDFNNEGIIKRPVTDGKRNNIGKARILRREEVHLPAGTFMAIVIEPDLAHVRGVFEKDKNARMLLWITDDERRQLVKVESKVRVGSFVAELVSVQK